MYKSNERKTRKRNDGESKGKKRKKRNQERERGGAEKARGHSQLVREKCANNEEQKMRLSELEIEVKGKITNTRNTQTKITVRA